MSTTDDVTFCTVSVVYTNPSDEPVGESVCRDGRAVRVWSRRCAHVDATTCAQPLHRMFPVCPPVERYDSLTRTSSLRVGYGVAAASLAAESACPPSFDTQAVVCEKVRSATQRVRGRVSCPTLQVRLASPCDAGRTHAHL